MAPEPLRVLVVEDEPACLELMVLRLEALGCEPLAATRPAEALAMARALAPDLILLDLKLDERDAAGIEVLVALKADPAPPPIYLHSVYVAHPTDMPEAWHLADGYLNKPFRFAELAEIVARIRTRRVQTQMTSDDNHDEPCAWRHVSNEGTGD